MPVEGMTLRELKARRAGGTATSGRRYPDTRGGGGLAPTLGRQIAGGGLVGLSRDLVAGPIVRLLIDALPGIDQDYLSAVEKSIEGKPAATVAKFIGEFLPMVPQVMGAGAIGRIAITAFMRSAALKAAAKGAAIKGVGQIGRLAERAEDIGGIAAKATTPMKIERAAEIVGANVAIGGYFGVKSAVEGANPREALEDAAFAAIVGGAFETGVVGIGLLTKHGRARFIDQNAKRKAWETEKVGPEGETGAGLAAKITDDALNDVRGLRDGVHKILDVEKQFEELVQVGGKKGAALEAVHVQGKMTAPELAEVLGITQSNARGLLSKLKKDKLVSKRATTRPREEITTDQAPGALGLTRTTEFRTTKEAIARTRTEVVRRKPRELSKQERDFYDELVAGPVQTAKGELEAARTFERARLIMPHTRAEPYNHAGKRSDFREWMLRLVQTPESMIGEGGEGVRRLMQGLKLADDEVIKESGRSAGLIRQMYNNTIKTLGVSHKEAAKGALLRYSSAFERGELKKFLVDNTKLRPDQINDVYVAFDQMSISQLKTFNRAGRMGGAPEHTAEKLASRGNKRFLTHMGDNLEEGDLIKLLEAKFGQGPKVMRLLQQAKKDPMEVADLIKYGDELGIDSKGMASLADMITPETLTKANIIRNRMRVERGAKGTWETRMANVGVFDYTRTLGGTAESKLAAGLPIIKNPFEAWLRYTNAGSRRYHYGKVIGPSGKLIDDVLDIAGAEGANTTLFRNIIGEFLDNKPHDAFMRDAAKYLTSFNVITKMTMGVLANMSQPNNTILAAGLRNSVNGAALAFKKENRAYIEQSLALNHSMIEGIGRSIDEQNLVLTGFEKAAHWMLKGTGFTAFERINRIHAGCTGHAAAKDIVTKTALGRLRGSRLDSARNLAGDLGFNLDDVVSKLRVTTNGRINQSATAKNLAEYMSPGNSVGSNTLDSAAFLLAQKTQFIPSRMRRPRLWNTPVGRIGFQFKTFALQQGRLLRDQVFGEAAAGNIMPLAYFMSISPIAGEFVGDMKAFVKGVERGDDLYSRALDNFMYLGGFGMYQDLFMAARYGDFAGGIFGPTFGTAASMFTAMAKFDVSEAARTVIKMPIFQAAHAFYRAIDHTEEIIMNYVESTSEADTAAPTLSRGRLLRKDIEDKQANR